MSFKSALLVSLFFFTTVGFQNCAPYSTLSNKQSSLTNASNSSDDSNDSSSYTSTEPLMPGMPDFHLRSDSPAIGAGVDVEEVETDYEGKPRIRGRFDIGAYAF